MNAVTTTTPKPTFMAGGSVAALVPQSLDEAFRVANAIAASGLAPKGVEKPEQVLVAIMAGAELGFAPFQAMQSFAVINGKPNIWGDAIPALLWARGFDIEEWFDDADQPTKAFCKITRPGGKEVERSFSLADAKRAGLLGKSGPWTQYQPRMMQMRARAFAARDGAADVLRGMQIAEEVQDYPTTVRDVTPARTGLRARLEAAAQNTEGFSAAGVDAALNGDQIPEHDTETGEVIEATDADDSFSGDRPAGEGSAAGPAEPEGDDPGPAVFDLAMWANDLLAAVEGYDAEAFDALEASDLEKARFAQLTVTDLPLRKKIEDAIGARKKALAE